MPGRLAALQQQIATLQQQLAAQDGELVELRQRWQAASARQPDRPTETRTAATVAPGAPEPAATSRQPDPQAAADTSASDTEVPALQHVVDSPHEQLSIRQAAETALAAIAQAQ